MNRSIYCYEDPSLFLRDAWNAKRAFNKNFTLRAWAKQLGISSHGTFYQIIKGKRPLPKKYVQAISNSLELGAKESVYLETLIDFSKAKTLEHKSYYKERLDDLSPQESLSFYEVEAFNFLKNPLNGAIIELTSLEDFCSDVSWIKSRLRIEASINDIKNSLELLVELGLLKKNTFGRLERTNEYVYTKQDVQNEALQEYHKNVLALGAEEVSKQNISQREYNAVAMGIKSSDIPKIKEEIRNFLNGFIKKYEASQGEADEVYQLGIQFFGLTHKETLQ